MRGTTHPQQADVRPSDRRSGAASQRRSSGQPGPVAADPDRWRARWQELLHDDGWILDGDLGRYDRALRDRLRAADTIIVLDFAFLRCAWRTIRRGRERGDYWRWVWAYRRRRR
jgi:hypothetical protein